MLERLSRRNRNIALAILAVLLLWFCWSIRSVLNPLLLGYLLAYILHPLVLRIERLGMTRRTAVNLTFGMGFLGALLISLAIVSQMSELGSDYLEDRTGVIESEAEPLESSRNFRERLQVRVDELYERFREWGLESVATPSVPDFSSTAKSVAEYLSEHTDESLEVAGRGVSLLNRAVRWVMRIGGLFVLVPLYTYYFLFVLRPVHETLRRYLPKRDRERIARIGGKIGEVIASFFRGRLTVCFFKGLFLSIGLTIADVKYAFVFGMLSGFLSILPFFGPFLGFLAAFIVGIVGHGVLGALLRTGIVFGLAELIEGYVLIPKILGDTLGLHPLVVFFSLLAGGAALGILGVLAALPLTASIVILVQEFVLPALKDWADEDPPKPKAGSA